MKPGTKIGGKYRLVRQLGEGGMGVVWSAVHEEIERKVALKLIRGLDPVSDDQRQRLLREARACGRISHRNVVQIFDVGQTENGDPFLVMELLSGETVAERLARQRRLPAEVALRIAAETARGLRAAHEAKVIHRDLKPSNLFLHEEPGADAPILKIVDFGVSKTLAQQDASHTATGKTMGSPAYMSPEQVRGLKTVDHRTDLWSLGVVLAEMISGRRVFQGLTPYGAAAEVLSGRIRSLADMAPDTDPRIVALVDRCLQRDVNKRFASADEFLEAVAPLLGDDRPGLPAIPPAPPPASPRSPAPLPVITNGTDSSGEQVTPTEFAPPPVVEDEKPTERPPPMPEGMLDSVRPPRHIDMSPLDELPPDLAPPELPPPPPPTSVPPPGPHGLPVLSRDSMDSIIDDEPTRAEPMEGMLEDPTPPSAPGSGPQVVLWDEYVRRRAKEADPAGSRPMQALDPDAPRLAKRRQVIVMVLVVAVIVAAAGVIVLLRS